MRATRPAIGIGLRSGASAAALVAVVEAALARARARAPELDFADAELFTVESKRGERGLREAAGLLSRRLVFFAPALLAAVDAKVKTRSALSLKHYGTGSVAEAAALAGAGAAARLLVPRLSGTGVTCAIAVGGPDRAPATHPQL